MMVKRFSRDIATQRLRRPLFSQCARTHFRLLMDTSTTTHNTYSKPSIWTKTARDIRQKIIHANGHLSCKQNAILH
jgi:hypothetical protein